MEESVKFLQDIGLSIIAAAAGGLIARALKQPLLLGYLAAGIALGPNIGFGFIESRDNIEHISELGLMMLLFVIGLEIRLPEIKRLGVRLFGLGIAQFGFCFLLSVAFFAWLAPREGPYDLLYLGIAGALSSTLIVVKLLYDKFEIETVYGRITLGILILQDLWAILFIGLQPSLADPRLIVILQSLGGVVALVALAMLVSRFVLQRVYRTIAHSGELVLILAAAWCFLICGLAHWMELSVEMGALVAGLAISAFPYANDLVVRISGIRDFFITLFFVALGMKFPVPELSILWLVGLTLVFIYANRLLTIATFAHWSGLGLRNGLLASINLSQVSEFTLVIAAIGVSYGHISANTESFLLSAMLGLSLVSAYAIRWNHSIVRSMLHFLARLGVHDRAMADPAKSSASPRDAEEHEFATPRDVWLLGYFRIARGFLEEVERNAPALKERIAVADFNPAHRRNLEQRGYEWRYVDLAHPEALAHGGIERASLIFCTVSDVFLRGITTTRLLAELRRLAPEAEIVMTADEPSQAERLMDRGATHAITPGYIAGQELFRWFEARG